MYVYIVQDDHVKRETSNGYGSPLGLYETLRWSYESRFDIGEYEGAPGVYFRAVAVCDSGRRFRLVYKYEQ